MNTATDRFETRARELMLTPEARRRYVVIMDTGVCPDCQEPTKDFYESTVCNHARLCLALEGSK
jgi:NMD protein affecting ribosome stability and mRNA decay